MFAKLITFLLCLITIQQVGAQTQAPLAQFPSPMLENIRRHERVTFEMEPSKTIILNDILPKPVTIYLPANLRKSKQADLLIHFHGLAPVVAYAAYQYKYPLIAVSVNLGSGSAAYAQPFVNDAAFEKLRQAVLDTVRKHIGRSLPTGKIILSGFSAGYGAIRSILLHPAAFKDIQTVLLLDGLHTSYIPERKVLAEGGLIDSISLDPFIQFAREAINKLSGKKFMFTHSEIFPGTFSSTTETAQYLLQKLNIKTIPVLKWGPLGMQQISKASSGNFSVLGFAGNTAPDHIDHFHGLFHFLHQL
ncbi:hypothetical protein U0035_11075 [Niabella yanshanensis]|uniref:Alpha/beta hydrolase n=1 Tax=Niabella yanshanensis TaxID=577386 RepID=A0ABZ0WDD5_9BACT|nr:hypothetical protein [Niabella yanshanensis]WQD40690.1 hypothetical protein U0035_11075 [Niabella yanshanensis]